MSAVQYDIPMPRFAVTELDDRYYCPISCDIMQDPVTIAGDPSGQSYERASIEAWFQCCVGPKRAPTSNVTFENPVLVSNSALRNEIHARAAHDTQPSAPPAPVDGFETSAPVTSRFAAAPTAPAAAKAATPSAPPFVHEAFVPAGPPPPPERSERPERVLPFPRHAGRVPREIGATGRDYRNVIALGRGRIAHEVRGNATLAAVVAGCLGAVGGLTGTIGVAVGVACGTVAGPCLAVIGGLGLVAAGTGAGAWIRRRRAELALAKPDIARKVAVLHEMRRAFSALSHPGRAEKAILRDIRAAIDLIDNPRADWWKSFKWAAGAAVLAIPLGIMAGLAIATRFKQAARESTATPTRPSAAAPEPRTAEAAYRSPRERYERSEQRGNTYEFNFGPRYETRNVFSDIASEMLLRHQFGRTRVDPFRDETPPAFDADIPVRVPMKTAWLEALDPHSYARLTA